jgi:hypothetical protein
MTIARKPSRTSTRPRALPSEWKVLRASDPVRWSRVQTAQARIASGYYERDDVRDYVVDQILRELKRR